MTSLYRTYRSFITGLMAFPALLFFSCQKGPEIILDNRPEDSSGYMLKIPPGFPSMDMPADNPMSSERVSLGKKLFHDPILSGDFSQSCASCHMQELGFGESTKVSTGIDGIQGTRNASPLINVGWSAKLFWDGRASGLEEQALEPVPNPVEMHLAWDSAEVRLNNHPEYPELFKAAFGVDEITREHIVKAIAQFERTLISGNSKYDKYKRGEVSLSLEEMAGMNIFFTEKGECFHCHGTILFTDNLFHNNGLDKDITKDPGLGGVTGNFNDYGKFKTPTLRNIEVTAPYMHDGRFATLKEVLDFYSDSVNISITVDPIMGGSGHSHGGTTGFHLSETDKQLLIAFLKTLTDREFLENPEFKP